MCQIIQPRPAYGHLWAFFETGNLQHLFPSMQMVMSM